MKTIGVISDTHGLLRDEAVARLRGVDHILHAGDIGHPDIVLRLAELAPVSAIRGNVDTQDWALGYPEALSIDLFGTRLVVIHDRKDLVAAPAGTGLVVSGHSHRPGIETVDGVLFLNPGSAGPRRFRLPVTLATVAIGQGAPVATIHALL